MKKSSENRKRLSNIELLRIVAAMGVIVLHYNNPNMGGGLKITLLGSPNSILLHILESVFVVAVNVFVLTSGYFMINSNRRDLLKPIRLIVQVMLFSCGVYLIKVLGGIAAFEVQGLFRSLIPANWFVILYVVLYLVSPYINVVVNKLSKEQNKLLIIILLCLFSIYPTVVDVLIEITKVEINSLSSVGAYGSQYGYTIVNFCMVYVIGAYLNKYKIQWRSVTIVSMFVANTCLLTIWAHVDEIVGYTRERSAWEYCNPFVILQTVLLFLLFERIKIQSMLINKLAQATFAVYLLHMYFLPYIKISMILEMNNPIITVGHIIISCIAIYLVCWITNLIYELIMEKIYKYVKVKWKNRTFSVDVE